MKRILSILMAGLMVAAMVVPAMSDTAGTGANVNDLASTYVCSGTSITTQPDPVGSTAGTVSYSLVISDDNGDDTIPSTVWTAEVNFGSGTQTDSLAVDTADGDLERTCTGTGSIPTDTAAGTYTVTFKLGTTTVCTTTVTVTSVTAYEIDFDAVAYGSVNPDASSTVNGDTTMETVGTAPPVKPTIENKGNVAMDVEMSIVDAGGNPETLFEGNTAAIVGSSASQTLATTTATFDVNIVVGGTAKIDSTLTVPIGIQASSYSGTLTVTGIAG